MDFVVKISDDYTAATYQAQFINPPDLEWEKELEGDGGASFLLPIYDDQIAAIIEWKKVEIYEIKDDGSDLLHFSGVITDPIITLKNIKVVCGSEKKYLQKKILFADKSWAGTSITTILTTLTDEANARDGGVNGNLTFTTDLADVITKDFKKGDNYFDILNTIAKQIGAEWEIVQNEIRFMQTIGTDRAAPGSGDDFVEFVYSSTSPNENNITEYVDKRKGTIMATSVIGKSGAAYQNDTQNTGTFGHLEKFVSLSDGGLADQVQAYLDEHAALISTVEIKANTTKIDFEKMNVGDLVKIRIEVGNPILDTDTSIKILKTKTTIINGFPQVDVSLGEVSRLIADPGNILAKLDKRLRAVELQ